MIAVFEGIPSGLGDLVAVALAVVCWALLWTLIWGLNKI